MSDRNRDKGPDSAGAVLVTGAGRRIGAAIARALGADGWHVFVHYNRSEKNAAVVAEDIAGAGGSAEIVPADLADPDAPSALVERCSGNAAPLRALVNNASLFEYDRIDTLGAASFDAHQAVNLRAPVLLAKAFAAALGAEGQGTIVNLLDNKVFAINPDYFSYTISKVGLHGATRALAMALAPNIRVNGVAPGITLVSGSQSEEQFARAHRNNPLGRGADPEDIVRAVRFILASPAMTGETIVVDGGQVLQRLPRDVAFMRDSEPGKNR